jgi:hypothetical protein
VVHALLSRLSTIYGLGLELSEMERAGRRFERQVNEALQHNPEVEQYVKQLESREDEPDAEANPPTSSPAQVELPRGEDVVRQLEEFLRQHAAEKQEESDDDPRTT